jgi:dihydrofolate reductase
MTAPETRLVYYVAGSLDGFIATEDNSLDWLFALGTPSESSYLEFVADVGAIAMGSVTYEWIQRNSEKAQAEAGSSWPYAQPTWVFTRRRLEAVPGADIRFFSGDTATAHAEMREASQGKNIWIVGGGDLAGQFYDAGLLDEIIVQLGAVTLGQGKSLLPRRILSPALRLTTVRQMSDRMVELRFEVQKPRA